MQENPLLVAGGRFHGHIGPFLAVGLKMGLTANERLGRDPMDMKAVVRVEARPPRSCVVDGIQYSTGCTMGKGNITIEPDPAQVAARFSTKTGAIQITLKPEFLARIENDLDGAEEKAIVDYAFRIMDTAPEEMLEVTE
jgi:formylmethanofuran dehydrogenase subunit E